jgi:hypothetical protein
MLTTIDNPYDPFDKFDEWFAFDMRAGHHTPGLLARIAVTSTELSDADQLLSIEQAIDEIIREDLTGLYKKVSREIDIE